MLGSRSSLMSCETLLKDIEEGGEHCSLQVLFENFNLALARDMLMGVYPGASPGTCFDIN